MRIYSRKYISGIVYVYQSVMTSLIFSLTGEHRLLYVKLMINKEKKPNACRYIYRRYTMILYIA